MNKIIRYFLENKLITLLFVVGIVIWGFMVAPFNWEFKQIPRNPVPVDAIPDIGENQQIVFTNWPGRSPRDIEDQITYPLTVALLGVPGVKTVRSFSYFGYSSIYIIFKEDIEFYWSRSRVLEKLSSLPQGTLPEGVSPALGPDATALGQIFWYTIEGRDKNGNTTGGWDPDEIRSVQDWYVRYALQSAEGVSEVSSIGGFVKEYQIDINPDALRSYNVPLSKVIDAVRKSNLDVGARTIEVNNVEYVIRGLGFIRSLEDIENIAVDIKRNNAPVRIKDIANVHSGPALRRGALDKNGAEVVGGVVVVRYGDNPLTTIKSIKDKIREISPGLPSKTLSDGTESKLAIVPFYDRSGLINKTLGTLNSTLVQQILVTSIVIIVMIMHFASSFLISALLPLAILVAFIFMRLFGVDANIVALSGIAIAIGTMVDMGIVLSENIFQNLSKKGTDEKSSLENIYEATVEVSGAITTSALTTIVSFLPVFALEAAEGKLFKPLAFTKTFALVGALFISLIIIPPAAHFLYRNWSKHTVLMKAVYFAEIFLGVLLSFKFLFPGIILSLIGIYSLLKEVLDASLRNLKVYKPYIVPGLVILIALYFLARSWLPLGLETGVMVNIIFVAVFIGLILGFFKYFQSIYPSILEWCLRRKMVFLILPGLILLSGVLIWSKMGEEFMPSLDEGSFLYMPTTMPHASIGESLEIMKKLDLAISSIPEVDQTVGKLGRVDSSLDPAPVSMFENIINYKSEYITGESGKPLYFEYDNSKDEFVRDDEGKLIEDSNGRPFRQWREHIKTSDDIWDEIVKVAKIPGVTSAPKLQPIQARIVMLQSGMRAPMGVKVKGDSLEIIDKVGQEIEKFLKQVPSIDSDTVIADRVVGKPYLEIDINRSEIARYGLRVKDIQDILEVAVGGKSLTTTVEARERYSVRIRYKRELRDDIEGLGNILIPTPMGQQLPLRELADIKFERRAQVIKSEDTFLTSYVIFNKKGKYAEVEVVNQARDFLDEKISSGELNLPSGASFSFAGSYENQVRAKKKLSVILPVTLFLIYLLLYFRFNSSIIALLVFTSVFVAWSGGFIMLWLYSLESFLDFSLLGINFRELFQIREFNLSVAVWVGFIALFGIAIDDGILMSTYISQILKKQKPDSVKDLRHAVIEAAKLRIRPAIMTTGTTLLALLPILTSRGIGSDIMVPMAIPAFGGMLIAILTVFVIPVLYCAYEEYKLTAGSG